jgi:hypothetical protein
VIRRGGGGYNNIDLCLASNREIRLSFPPLPQKRVMAVVVTVVVEGEGGGGIKRDREVGKQRRKRNKER